VSLSDSPTAVYSVWHENVKQVVQGTLAIWMPVMMCLWGGCACSRVTIQSYVYVAADWAVTNSLECTKWFFILIRWRNRSNRVNLADSIINRVWRACWTALTSLTHSSCVVHMCIPLCHSLALGCAILSCSDEVHAHATAPHFAHAYVVWKNDISRPFYFVVQMNSAQCSLTQVIQL